MGRISKIAAIALLLEASFWFFYFSNWGWRFFYLSEAKSIAAISWAITTPSISIFYLLLKAGKLKTVQLLTLWAGLYGLAVKASLLDSSIHQSTNSIEFAALVAVVSGVVVFGLPWIRSSDPGKSDWKVYRPPEAEDK